MAWFLVPYKARPDNPRFRYCAIDDFTALIAADGGSWSEAECLGNHAVVKVVALPATIATLAAQPGYQRIPKDLLDDTLASLTTAQRQAIRDKLVALGYPLAEIQADLGSNLNQLGQKTVRQVLRFALKRRLKPRYDAGTDTIFLDGPEQVCKSVEAVDAAV